MSQSSSRLFVGVIVGAHGIKGGVKIKSFTDQPEDVGAYGPVQDEGGQHRFKIKVQGLSKGLVLAHLKEVVDRNQAEALKGTRLYVERSQLPPGDEDEFLVADLIGCRVTDPDGIPLGKVGNIYNFGAGEVLDVVAEQGSFMVPFTHQNVPEVNVGAGLVVVVPPVYAPVDEGEDKGAEQ